MNTTPRLAVSSTIPAACLLSLATVVAAQSTAPTQDPTKSVEERLSDLERQVRQENLGVQAQDVTFRATWVRADGVGIPDLQESQKPGVASTVDLKLWGRVNFAATYDNFQGSNGIGGPDFMNFVASEGNEDLSFNARDTRFGFAAANAWDAWTARAVVELDFYGDTASANLAPRLRLGYVELLHQNGFSLRAGQDWVPIAQQNPGTMDFGILSYGGNLWGRAPQITARYKTGAHEVLLSAMHYRTLNAEDQQERMPWVFGRYAFLGLMDGKGVLALGGGVRRADVSNSGGSVHESATDHLVAAEVKLPLAARVTLTAEAWEGAGVGREFTRTGFDYNADGEAMSGCGGFVSGEWRFDDRWSLNVGCGLDQPDDADTTGTTLYGTTVPYDSNRVLFVNVQHQLSKQLGMGIELIDFRTELTDEASIGADGQVLRGQRIAFGMWFVF